MARNIIRRPEAEARTGLSRSTIYRLVDRGEFPRPVQLGARSIGWFSDEVDAWLEARAAARPAPKSAAA